MISKLVCIFPNYYIFIYIFSSINSNSLYVLIIIWISFVRNCFYLLIDLNRYFHIIFNTKLYLQKCLLFLSLVWLYISEKYFKNVLFLSQKLWWISDYIFKKVFSLFIQSLIYCSFALFYWFICDFLLSYFYYIFCYLFQISIHFRDQ